MKVRSLKDIERDIRKETEKANTAAQYDMYASSIDDMFRAALAVAVTVFHRRGRSKNYIKKFRALFHCWEQRSEVIPPSPMIGGHSGGTVTQVLGIIEREDGTIHKAYPEEIRFIDGDAKRYFLENATEEEENNG